MNCLGKVRIRKLFSRRATIRTLATVSPAAPAARNHKIVVVGNGSAGVAVSHQLLRKGKFAQGDIAVIDPAKWHHYQPGWTLVGGGLKDKKALRTPMNDLVDGKMEFYNKSVASFNPDNNFLTLESGDRIHYDHLVVAPGIKIDYGSVNGLSEALRDPNSPVASIYSYDYCDKVFRNIQRLKAGSAIFTQPAGVIKCAGAPQKIMWLALDHWRQSGLYQINPKKSAINVTFATGLPSMFGVPKYSATLDALRKARGVEALFEHDLVSISGNTATFARPNGQDKVTRRFSFLHVAPKNVAHDFISASPLSNAAGYIDVDPHSLRHNKWPNIWSLGDAANLPTSKTVAAITSQALVLTHNVLRSLDAKAPTWSYDGYTSCPLLTGEKKVLLAEFAYGGVPKESFGRWLGVDQAVPRRAFYYLKKHFFPWVYDWLHVKGRWGGPRGWVW